MWLDTIALVLLAGFALAGFLRGALASFLALFCLVLAYAVAALGASRDAAGFARAAGLPDALGGPLLGAALFVATFVLSRLLSTLIVRRAARRRRQPRTALDRLLGAGFGALRGGVFVLLLCVLALWVDALRQSGRAEFVPALTDSRAAAVSGAVVEAGVLAATDGDGPGSRFLARVASRPAASLGDIEVLLADPHVLALRADALFWTYVEHGAVDAALNQGSFLAVQEDGDLRQRFAELGLVDGAAAEQPAAFRDAVRAVLDEVGPRLRGLRNDPRVRELVDDPDVVARLRAGETVSLLSDERFRDLVADVATRAH